jgi:hypothetical protein
MRVQWVVLLTTTCRVHAASYSFKFQKQRTTSELGLTAKMTLISQHFRHTFGLLPVVILIAPIENRCHQGHISTARVSCPNSSFVNSLGNLMTVPCGRADINCRERGLSDRRYCTTTYSFVRYNGGTGSQEPGKPGNRRIGSRRAEDRRA